MILSRYQMFEFELSIRENCGGIFQVFVKFPIFLEGGKRVLLERVKNPPRGF